MISTSDIDVIRRQVRSWHAAGETVAFVPTMGNLHQGHISLVTEGLEHADHLVASIFVNPMQFAAHEDLDTYPRTLDEDLQALQAVGTELVFTPTSDIIYPQGIEHHTKVLIPEDTIGDCGEAQSRPGFFVGVATVVLKLFNIVQPDVAVFGRKDYQQLVVIQTLVNDLALPIKVIGVDTYREPNGLAMSSRNNYLTTEQKEQAAVIKKSMDRLTHQLQSHQDTEAAITDAKQQIQDAGLQPDYITIRNAHTLQTVSEDDNELVVMVAAKLGSTRLIDNQCFNIYTHDT
ncbi:pantoate--beta-alanine ligase [Parashewanella spongiae]|uniref:Pantothenate synthetase n=1 Tax=Parashewanella spongiae TaxID=342950 RepID=A0A3A6TRS8_9GAMM|nr:pantoate--beta-alanine ligase [Parashewanella spongiae]MCL1079993.1 pantoate--beta-alanine ligase [Parashewanella spongiae]RJY16877.1 pantoate--beta-alanine ligase [Parashewanella spongiae]